MRTLISLSTLLIAAVGFSQSPDYWVLVHTGDELAKSRILKETDFLKAREAAATLGYEAVVEKQIAYFFPVPSWSAGRGAALQELLSDAIENGFERELDGRSMPAYQRDHLSRLLAGLPVGGDLGQNIKSTKLGIVSVRRSVDLQFEFGGRVVTIPFAEREIANWYSAPRTDIKVDSPAVVDYPDRKELFGLGTLNFALSVSRPTTTEVFDKIVDRARELLKLEREAAKKAVEAMVATAFDQAFANEAAQKLKSGAKSDFSSLPRGLQLSLMEHARQNPGLYGFGAQDPTDALLSGSQVSIPNGGMRVFVNFRLDGKGTASDGSPVGYAVGWELTDLLSVGG